VRPEPTARHAESLNAPLIPHARQVPALHRGRALWARQRAPRGRRPDGSVENCSGCRRQLFRAPERPRADRGRDCLHLEGLTQRSGAAHLADARLPQVFI